MRSALLAAVFAFLACSPPPVSPGTGGGNGGNGGAGGSGGSAGSAGGGTSATGGGSTGTGGGTSGTGGGTTGSDGGWSWVPVAGSKCGAGATAGFAIDVASSDELFIFLQGGGACWNQGTCVPSLMRFGPICYYGENICLADVPGGTQPTSSHVIAGDPFPADGGGALPSELGTISRVKALDRAAPDNPFRSATFVFIPYCTGDLHSGATERTYQYKRGAFDPPSNFVMHFRGATNMDAYLARLQQQFPSVRRIWLTGASAGGYGATFNFDRVARAFPQAEVHLLADSSPFIDTFHFGEWRDEWSMQFPTGCTSCRDGGLPAVVEHLATAYPSRRLGLLSYDQDKVIAWFFLGGQGPDPALNPPVAAFNAELRALQSRYDARANTKYFVVPGDQHVLWGEYGTRLSDGGYSAPKKSRDGGTDLFQWVNAWVDGGAAWQSTR